MSNKFLKSEEIGRNYFLNTLVKSNVTEYEFSEDPTCPWDCKYKKDGKLYIVEIKVRNASSNTYPDWILEKKKYMSLMAENIREELNGDDRVNVLYVNYFSDGVAVWRLNDMKDLKIENKRCKATTAKYNGFVDKEIIMLKLDNAIIYEKRKESINKAE